MKKLTPGRLSFNQLKSKLRSKHNHLFLPQYINMEMKSHQLPERTRSLKRHGLGDVRNANNRNDESCYVFRLHMMHNVVLLDRSPLFQSPFNTRIHFKNVPGSSSSQNTLHSRDGSRGGAQPVPNRRSRLGQGFVFMTQGFQGLLL